MIKFQYLVHKETGTVIKYEEWLELYSCDNGIILKIENRLKYNYDAEQMIFTDDFEIIYDSEFTFDELYFIYDRVGEDENLKYKVWGILKDREKIESKYRIEV